MGGISSVSLSEAIPSEPGVTELAGYVPLPGAAQ
jgi:hypothetical protein